MAYVAPMFVYTDLPVTLAPAGHNYANCVYLSDVKLYMQSFMINYFYN